MLDTLYKKAIGYDVEEVTSEYSVDEEGNRILVKEKKQIKHIPPDLASIKAYMEMSDEKLSKMDDKQLEKEKQRLLKELKKLEEKK